MGVGSDYKPEMLVDLLPLYYKRLFPYQQYVRWLQYGNLDKNYLANREFSFTLEDDIYIRYLSFSSQEELEAEMIKRKPHKIDLGAVFNARPSEHKKLTNFTPQERELVFDIDLTDYDDVRTCCDGAKICQKCWRYMTVAVKILDASLRDDFGYSNILWVYSGRRGVHCWVCDEEARKLTIAARGAVAEYLQVVSGSQTKKVILRGDRVHPSIERAVNIIKGDFEKLCLIDQDTLGNKEVWTKVTNLIPDEDLRSEVETKMAKEKNSVDRWNVLRKSCLAYNKSKDWRKRKTSDNILSEIMLQLAYPRLDIAVSKGLNHLLKAPFCIHPKTGRVCVPFNPAKAERFNPTEVPTVLQLVEEIDAFTKDASEEMKNVKAYKKTSMKEPMIIFEEFLSNLAASRKGKLMEQSDAKMEF
jgi:DNA primase small subunit